MTGILKVDQWKDSGDNALMTSDGAGNLTANVSIGGFSSTGIDDNATSNALTLDSSANLQFNSGYGSVATAYGCRAWVNFNGTGTVSVRGSGNVSSITDNGTGNYTMNFSSSLPDANYATIGTTQTKITVRGAFFSIRSNSSGVFDQYNTSGVQFITAESTTGAVDDLQYIGVAVIR